MRLTLEQLKGMDDMQLKTHWLTGNFPFEFIKGCGGGCLTMHAHYGCAIHGEIVKETRRMGFEELQRMKGDNPNFVAGLRAHLEELYALRLFHDSLYPQPVPETPAEVKESASERTLSEIR